RPTTIACDPGFIQYYGRPECVRFGRECPPGQRPWPQYVPEDNIRWWVRSSTTTPSGDGLTELTPFNTIAEALAVAQDGDKLAIGRGDYTELLASGTPTLQLLGACAAETRLHAADDDVLQVINAFAEGTVIDNLTFDGGRNAAIGMHGAGGRIADVEIGAG